MPEKSLPPNGLTQEKTRTTGQPNGPRLSEKSHDRYANSDDDPMVDGGSEGGNPGLKCYLVRRNWVYVRLEN